MMRHLPIKVMSSKKLSFALLTLLIYQGSCVFAKELRLEAIASKTLTEKNLPKIGIPPNALNNINSKKVNITITGTVTDQQNETLIGVSVSIVGSIVSTQTNVDGKYSISAPDNAKSIKFTYLGFEDLIIPINGKTVINAKLISKQNALDEVIVVGYGTQKKESVVGSISQIKGDALKRVGGVTSVSEALQGLIPGLTAINTNGKPGSDASDLLIRGVSTLNNSSPFVLVDGVERNLNQLDPNEIETISVLKDASATAVYGTRGANGVILITTKRGVSGKPEFSFTSNFGFKTPTVNQEYADYVTSLELYNEAAINDKLYSNIIPESYIEAWRQNIANASPTNQYFPQIDWWDQTVNKVGYQKSYNLNARGGSDFMRYFVSVGYLNDGDIYNTQSNDQFDPSFKVQRYNWRSNFDFDITKSTLFSINLSGNFRYRNQPGYRLDGGGEDGFGQSQFFQKIFSAPRNEFPLTYRDGFPGESSLGEHNMFVNLNQGGQRIYKYFQGFYDAQLKQKLDFVTKGLSFRGKISLTSGSNYETAILNNIAGNAAAINVIRYYRRYDLTKPQIGANGEVNYPLIDEKRYPDAQTQIQPLTSSGDNIYGYERDLYYEGAINYARKFGSHDVSALALVNRRANISQGNVNTPFVLGIGLFGEDYVGRVTYGFKNRYLAEFNGSYTGSSKFAPGKRFGFFPSGAIGWVASDEPYFKKLFGNKVLDFLKISYNYGIVGSDNGIPSDLFLQSFGSGGSVRFGNSGFNSFGPIYNESQTANPNATWEKATKQNLGIDFEFFNKLRGKVDLFREDRKDILIQLVQVPRSFGNEAPVANVGVTKNHGIDFELGYNDKVGDDFKYYANVNYSWSENRIVFRDDARLTDEYLKSAGKQIGFATRYIQAGYYNSLDDIYNSSNSTGLGASQGTLTPGDFLYLDFNGDGVIDSKDQIPMKYSNRPLQTVGLTLGFNYKNWGFNVLLYSAFNVFKETPDLFLWDFNSGFINGQPNITQRWTPQNIEGAQKPALHITNIARHNQNASSTYTYVDASYLRIKNAELSYSVPAKTTQKVGLKSLQVYGNGNNLLTFTKLDKRIDPETNGADVYPIVRRFNLGLRANF